MVVIRVECSVEEENEQSWWQYTGTSTERTGGISIVGGGEVVTTGDERDKGDGVGNEEPLDGGVCSESQSSACSVGYKGREVHLKVAMLDGRVLEEEEWEVRVAVFVNEGELIMFDEWFCE